MGKKSKRPFAESVKAEKKPVAEEIDFKKRTPVWRIHMLDLDGPFGWRQCKEEKLCELKHKLADLESMTWGEILRGPHNHWIEPTALGKEARERLVEIEQDDIPHLFQISFSNKERCFGVLDSNVFKILWWDPEHSVYRVQKKNT